MEESKFIWLGSNVKNTNDGKIFGNVKDIHTIPMKLKCTDTSIHQNHHPNTDHNNTDEHQILPINIGFFGICTPHTPYLSYPGPTVTFENVTETTTHCIAELKKLNTDINIAITHQTISEDTNMVKQFPRDIHVILGGHEHHANAFMEQNTLIFKAGQNANW
jgi:2',3'-cyclic-nucleotide 2'-phosphodiesterase (5'-nucleotidase family)